MDIYEKYVEEIKQELRSEGLDVTEITPTRQGCKEKALSIKGEGKIGVVIYPEIDFKNGVSAKDLAVRAIRSLKKGLAEIGPEIGPDTIEKFITAENLTIKVINSCNKENLDQNGVVYRELEDLFVVPMIRISEEARIQVKESILNILGMNKDEAIDRALENEAGAYQLLNMQEYVFAAMTGGDASSCRKALTEETLKGTADAIVITQEGSFGANVIANNAILAMIQGCIGDFYILPSSVHEIIIMPKQMGADPVELANMVREVNDCSGTVAQDELLGYSVYQFTENGLEIAVQGKSEAGAA